MTKDINKQIKKIISEILDKMDLGKIEIEYQENKQNDIQKKEINWPVFNIKIADPSLLIGRGGETLASLQHIVYILSIQQIDDIPRFMIDINGYRKDKTDRLFEMAKLAAEKAQKTHRPEVLEPMNSYQRKIIHTIIQDYDQLTSKSIGEEPNKRVIIKIK